jgi:hypothetical protein
VSGDDDPAAALETLAARLLAFFLAEAAFAPCFLVCARAGGSVPPRPRRAVDGAGGGGATGVR